MSQVYPLYPASQSQLYMFTASVQLPYKQGLDVHSLISAIYIHCFNIDLISLISTMILTNVTSVSAVSSIAVTTVHVHSISAASVQARTGCAFVDFCNLYSLFQYRFSLIDIDNDSYQCHKCIRCIQHRNHNCTCSQHQCSFRTSKDWMCIR